MKIANISLSGPVMKAALAAWLTLLLSACAGLGEIAPGDTAGSVLVMGVEVTGRNVQEMGSYYVFTFIGDNEEPMQIVKRPKPTANPLVFTELPPGDWTLVSFAARPAPGVTGFAGTSARQREVFLDFTLREGSIHILSQQLTISIDEARNGEMVERPRMTELTPRVRDRVESRIGRMGAQWNRVREPVGIVRDREESERRGLLQRILGD